MNSQLIRKRTVSKMAKPIQYITELSIPEAKAFLADILNPKPNPERDRLFDEARRLKFVIR